ncbi:MAG: hypothetical protein J6Y17_03115 [Elusimicrobiaceae bacterium]|nr:hypothetical protein [Elusimicrobiaceae bacterium]
MSLNEPEIIEAEIVENSRQESLPQGEVTWRANERPKWHTPGDHARPQGDRGGMLGGFLVLALGFIVTVIVLLVSVCIIIPFTLLMRLLGMHKRN